VRIEPVAAGVWASVAEDDDVAVGNAGFVDLGGETLVFDAHMSLHAARRLRDAAQAHGPVRSVLLSHWHGDHVYGAGAFDGATVVATERTAELMGERTSARLAQLKATPVEEFAGTAFAEIAETELPELELRLPDETFVAERTFRGEARTVQALTYGGGHTASDAVLWLADDGILFAGDLVVVESHPWVGDGDVAAWPGILERLAALAPLTIVPGHGPVAGPEAIDFVLLYLDALREAKADDENPFPGLAFAEGWTRNVRALAGSTA
jgi:glyoxylase-like metal-dependent hydrolase (beta-lactamase superfamily II)